MNLMISSQEYDFHSLVKVAEIAGLVGVVASIKPGDDYLVTFPMWKIRPKWLPIFAPACGGLENNIWNF